MINKFQGEYRWLSNFAKVAILYGGRIYLSTEAAYQAQKTLDLEERKKFETYTPAQAKKEGMKLQLRANWGNLKVGIMVAILRIKFDQEPFRSQLIATGDESLVEGNDWGDVFWGRCNGIGKNYLGMILMDIRGRLQDVTQA